MAGPAGMCQKPKLCSIAQGAQVRYIRPRMVAVGNLRSTRPVRRMRSPRGATQACPRAPAGSSRSTTVVDEVLITQRDREDTPSLVSASRSL
jgi:hypothetical protein